MDDPHLANLMRMGQDADNARSKARSVVQPVVSDALLPCPCCGSTHVDRSATAVLEDAKQGVVRCGDCGLHVATFAGQEEADRRWNTRAR